MTDEELNKAAEEYAFNKGVKEDKRLMMKAREPEKDEPKQIKNFERIKPKFAVGDVVSSQGWAEHTIQEIYLSDGEPIYICKNEDGIESHIPFSEQNKWELIQKEHKPNYCHHEVYETGWAEEYRKAYYHGWNDCNMQHAQLKKEQLLNQETIKLAEDHAFLASADWQREEIMKDAVEAVVQKIYKYGSTMEIVTEVPKEGGFKRGDKVRIIIVKEEEQK